MARPPSSDESDLSYRFNLDNEGYDMEASLTFKEGAIARDIVSEKTNGTETFSDEASDSDSIEGNREVNGEDPARQSLSQDTFSAEETSDQDETDQQLTTKKPIGRKGTLERATRFLSSTIMPAASPKWKVPSRRLSTGSVNLQNSVKVSVKNSRKKCVQSAVTSKQTHRVQVRNDKSRSCRKLSCYLCHEQFKPSALKLHLLTHYGVPCALCYNVFPDKKHLGNHICVPDRSSTK